MFIKAHVAGIEAAAFALWEIGVGRAAYPGPEQAWKALSEEVREHWRIQARAAVRAYKEAAK